MGVVPVVGEFADSANDYVGDLHEITIDGEVIQSTDHHPFWVVRGENLESRPQPVHVYLAYEPEATVPGRWIDSRDLRVGDIVLLKPDRQVAISAIAIRPIATQVYNFQVDELHNYVVGKASVLVHNNACVTQIDNVVAPTQGFDFGKHLRGLIGDAPEGMFDPHAHHVLFKKGLGPAQQALVDEGQAILRKVGIDPIYGKENLVWAPWRLAEQHGIDSLTKVVQKLRELEGSEQITTILLERCVNWVKKLLVGESEMSDSDLVMPIHRAIKQGNLSEVTRLIAGDKSLLHIWTPFGTWLQDAAAQGQLDIVRWLVTQGLDVNAYNESNESPPLTKAAARGHLDVVRFLIESGAALDTSDSVRNPLFAVIVGGISDSHTAIAMLLIDGGIDTKVKYNGENMKDMDALAFAKEWGRSEIVRLLENR